MGASGTHEAREATRGSAVKLGAEVSSRGLQLVTTLLLARGLGASEFGAFGYLSALAVVAAEAADLGLHGTATRALVAGTLPLRGVVLSKLRLTSFFLVATFLAHPFVPLLTPLLLWFVGSGWAEILGVALRARGRRAQEAALLLVLRLLGLVLVAAVLGQGGAALACFWALGLSTLPVILMGALLVRRAYAAAAPLPDPGMAAILRSSLPLAVNGGLALLSLRVELLVVSFLRGDLEAGYFLAALQVVQVLNSTIPTSISAGAMPSLTREALAAGTVDAARRRTASTVALAAAPACLGLALVAPALTEKLYGTAYAPSALTLSVLALSLVPLFLNGFLTHALIAAERARLLPRLTGLRVVLAGLFAALLVPAAGGPGAALGFASSELVLVALGARAARAAGFPVRIARPTLLALAASLPMAAAVWPVRHDLLQAILVGVLAQGATLAVLARSPRLRRELGYS